MLLVKKCQIFLYLDLVKIGLEKMVNNFVEKQETFFLRIKTKSFESPKIAFFQRGETPLLVKKCHFFIFCFRLKYD